MEIYTKNFHLGLLVVEIGMELSLYPCTGMVKKHSTYNHVFNSHPNLGPQGQGHEDLPQGFGTPFYI